MLVDGSNIFDEVVGSRYIGRKHHRHNVVFVVNRKKMNRKKKIFFYSVKTSLRKDITKKFSSFHFHGDV
jgi:hypothetical protein